ncbi:MAG: PH domain-containing protein [Acidobacteria bacterium]|nr:PH domain-containing protein [Acidobacteriota bacterium]
MNHPVAPALRASFNPLIRPYLVVTIGFTIAITIIGLPLAVIWFCGVGQWWARHYFAKLECELSDRTLRFRKGILFTIEKTIPLENIQDVTFIEGPVLRYFHLSILKFETAGHTEGQANNMQLTGIIDAHEYRNQILAARERLKSPAQSNLPATAMADVQLANLSGIERRLDEIIALLKQRQ